MRQILLVTSLGDFEGFFNFDPNYHHCALNVIVRDQNQEAAINFVNLSSLLSQKHYCSVEDLLYLHFELGV